LEQEALVSAKKTAEEDKRGFESSASQLQGKLESLKREKEQLQKYLEQQESEVKAAMAGKGGEVSGLAAQVETLKEQLAKAEGAVSRLKAVRGQRDLPRRSVSIRTPPQTTAMRCTDVCDWVAYVELRV
jgi:predicted RNase H-like nuclease (RuvC/YqgF family)